MHRGGGDAKSSERDSPQNGEKPLSSTPAKTRYRWQTTGNRGTQSQRPRRRTIHPSPARPAVRGAIDEIRTAGSAFRRIAEAPGRRTRAGVYESKDGRWLCDDTLVRLQTGNPTEMLVTQSQRLTVAVPSGAGAPEKPPRNIRRNPSAGGGGAGDTACGDVCSFGYRILCIRTIQQRKEE